MFIYFFFKKRKVGNMYLWYDMIICLSILKTPLMFYCINYSCVYTRQLKFWGLLTFDCFHLMQFFSLPIIVRFSKVESIWLVFGFQDESVLIWFSGKEEKHLKLSHVSRIISGQRTVSFQNWQEKPFYLFASLDLANSALTCWDNQL